MKNIGELLLNVSLGGQNQTVRLLYGVSVIPLNVSKLHKKMFMTAVKGLK